MKKLNILMICLLSMRAIAVSAQDTKGFAPLYPQGEIPNVRVNNSEEKERSEVGKDGIERISAVHTPAIAYYPAKPNKRTGTAIIICPGGGYGILAMSHEGHEIAKKFAENGIAAFVLKYRLPSDDIMDDKSIGPLQDAQQALLLVRKNAASYKVDPEKIGIIGFSAGGHLASTAGVHYSDPKIKLAQETSLRPDFMLLIYPVISMDSAITHAGSRKNLLGERPNAAQVRYFSNELQIKKDTPPTLLVHAEDDTAVPIANSQRFYDSLQKNKVPSKLLTYPHGGHGFGLNNKTTTDKWFDHALEWLHDLGY